MRPALLDASFLIALEREIEAGIPGGAFAWLRRRTALAGGKASLFLSGVSVAEFLEGRADQSSGIEFVARFRHQPLGFQHAVRCAAVQRRAAKSGFRFGENDAWQIAVADLAEATIVGRDAKAFARLGNRYDAFGGSN